MNSETFPLSPGFSGAFAEATSEPGNRFLQSLQSSAVTPNAWNDFPSFTTSKDDFVTYVCSDSWVVISFSR